MPGPSLERDRVLIDRRPGRNAGQEDTEMDPFTAFELAKLRIAERHEQAARERLVRIARAATTDEEHEASVWRRWALRRISGRITLAGAG